MIVSRLSGLICLLLSVKHHLIKESDEGGIDTRKRLCRMIHQILGGFCFLLLANKRKETNILFYV